MAFFNRIVLILSVVVSMSAPALAWSAPVTKGSVELAPELAEATSGLGGKYALVIGIRDYKNKPLPYAVEDAKNIGALLETRYGFTVDYLTSKQNTTKSAIEKAFGRLMKKVKEKDQVIIFFSGHGDAIHQGKRITGGYLVPVDGEPDSFSTLIPMTDIRFMASNLAARHTLFIIDTCYSGVAGGVISMDAHSEQTLAFVRAKLGRRGRQLMTAGKSGEIAQMMDDLGMSVYSFYLEKGLQGGADLNFDSVITMSELQAYVEPRVNAKTNGTQNPQYRDFIEEGDGQFVFVPIKKKDGNNLARRQAELRARLQREKVAREGAEAEAMELAEKQKIQELKWQIDEEKRRRVEAQQRIRQLEAERKKNRAGQEARVAMENREKFEALPEKTIETINYQMVFIKPGTFTMGQSEDEKKALIKNVGEDAYKEDYSDEHNHPATLSEGFYMGTTEVTVGQWRLFARATGEKTEAEREGWAWICAGAGKWKRKNGLYWDNPGFPQTDRHPVTCVSWNDVQKFIKWLRKEARTQGIDLPSEKQWEYAARAGTTTPFAFGECLGSDQANYNGHYPMPGCPKGDYMEKTVRVGSLEPNAWGLYDMHGNVWEWCRDWYNAENKSMVLRGGSWLCNAGFCRSAGRDRRRRGDRVNNVGFRLVAVPESDSIEEPFREKPLLKGIRRVVVDPAFGGSESGSRGYMKGVTEKAVTLNFAKQLSESMRALPNFEVILTRKEDRSLSPRERGRIAVREKGDIFISISTNSSDDERVYGIETMFSDLPSGPVGKVNESQSLAEEVHSLVFKRLRSRFSRMKDRGVRQDRVETFHDIRIPCIQIRPGFISNPMECKRLIDQTYVKLACEGIVMGVQAYADKIAGLSK